ncbi:valine--tRNA ligase [Candidatus Desantisbacteria bacterium]|nr:valine--tRNA ligase [Candidatus Desantisbacteria bacterium]
MNILDIPKAYEPRDVEEKWYKYWEENGCFMPGSSIGKQEECFSMVIPPPNVTGSLHMGHALNNTIQDILARWKRMQGINVLWVPGTDHAGIATQNVVERELKKQGLTRNDLGREKFIERVWEWKKQYGDIIIQQLKRLGSSCDWSRIRFTMDDGLSKAVREVFVQLYEQGLIYRDNYIVNWCPRCHTALSDIEAEHKDLNGHLYYLRYPIADEEDTTATATNPRSTIHDPQSPIPDPRSTIPNPQSYIVVATTRPETMLGDTAIAVNPEDERYQSLIGKFVVLPVLNRRIPIIADSFVEPEFGTGAVKVTPAHDPNDFEIGKRHSLPQINILNPDATMNENAGSYQGQDRYECRKHLLQDLQEQGLVEKIEEYALSVGHCYRCHTIVEPYLSPQWFIRMSGLAEEAIKAVEDGRIEFVPKSWEKTYFEWMRNIKDWCISRQIWWGHRIPVWYCQQCGKVLVEREDPVRDCPSCNGELKQDEDVLDTWFSSALWPFSTLGWPDNTPDLKRFYPTSVLSTGFDIIFFWVARMIMMGLKFQGDIPFHKVYIHALIRDAEGQKMSKSKGNVIDPLHVIDDYGTDALRFTLAIMAVSGRDILLAEERIEGYKHFCNKIWNAARFILMNLDDYVTQPEGCDYHDEGKQEIADEWIVSRLNQTIDQVTQGLESFNFAEASLVVYHFVWHEYCDWYLELIKPRLRQDDETRKTAQYLIATTFESILKLLHPFMPFITEDLWQRLPGQTTDDLRQGQTIMLSKWPKSGLINQKPVIDMELVMEVVSSIRNIRSTMNIGLKIVLPVIMVRHSLEETADVLKSCIEYIKRLGNIETVIFDPEAEKPHASAVVVAKGMEIYIPLEGLIDIEKEKMRLGKQIEEIMQALNNVQAKLNNPGFVDKAPQEVVDKVREQEGLFEAKKRSLEENLRMLAE